MKRIFIIKKKKKEKSWPIALSTGFGIGVSYAECQRTFNPTAIPGVKIIKTPPTPSV